MGVIDLYVYGFIEYGYINGVRNVWVEFNRHVMVVVINSSEPFSQYFKIFLFMDF